MSETDLNWQEVDAATRDRELIAELCDALKAMLANPDKISRAQARAALAKAEGRDA